MECPSRPHDPPLPGHATAPTFSPDLSALRPNLLRFARSRLRNANLAEDAVSEALLAAWQTQPTFSTPAQASAWVYGILRHKLVDQVRQQARELPVGDGLPEPDTRGSDWFVGGPWCGLAATQTEPDEACSHNQFVALVLRCCEQLPSLQRQAFVLRELGDEDPADICRQLGVSEGHLWVLMHRARLRLRQLLNAQWPMPQGVTKASKAQRRHRPPAASPRHSGQAEVDSETTAFALHEAEAEGEGDRRADRSFRQCVPEGAADPVRDPEFDHAHTGPGSLPCARQLQLLATEARPSRFAPAQ